MSSSRMTPWRAGLQRFTYSGFKGLISLLSGSTVLAARFLKSLVFSPPLLDYALISLI